MTVSSSNREFFSGGFNPEVRESVAEEDLIRSFGVVLRGLCFWREGRGNPGLAEYMGEKGGCYTIPTGEKGNLSLDGVVAIGIFF